MNTLAQICTTQGDLKDISEEVWQAILHANTPPTLYRNGDRVVWLERDDTGSLTVRAVNQGRLIHYLVRICDFFQYGDDDEKIPARPPKDLARDILARPDKSALPVLQGVSKIPQFGSDARLHSIPGYDPCTRFYFEPALDLANCLPEEHPSTTDIAVAKDVLLGDLLVDFPFVSLADKAHAIAAAIQPFVRLMIDGPTPLFLLEKPTPGTGGTLLAHVIAYPAMGCFASGVTQPRTEAEWRYSLLSWLRDGPSVVLIDNLTAPLDSGALASVLTGVAFRDRLVGTSDAITVPIHCTWLATGNNPVLSTEIARRAIRIRIDARTQHPDTGRTFKHANLRTWVTENCHDLIWAILTLVQAWVVAGCPAGQAQFGGFESWARVMGGILRVAGIDGFLANRAELRTMADAETARITPFLDAWWGRFQNAAAGVADLWMLAADLDLGTGSEQSRKIRLGNSLDKLRDRRFGNYQVIKLGLYKGAQRYRLLWATEGSAE